MGIAKGILFLHQDSRPNNGKDLHRSSRPSLSNFDKTLSDLINHLASNVSQGSSGGLMFAMGTASISKSQRNTYTFVQCNRDISADECGWMVPTECCLRHCKMLQREARSRVPAVKPLEISQIAAAAVWSL
ncbi:hypothetical protein EJ110_NYTH40158 [Nymphaea thermarum]|nr:hypothetical protein EJ110_NYTH40158 [Nymphaea thermarum]